MRDLTASADREVQVGGVSESGVFRIDASAKAFKVLIDSLYSDKPKAIVRELCTNAFDAHKAAGTTDRPFKVTLPTAFDPQFSVRDFGTGLKHADVMELYTTVFRSTKDQNNDAVGKFGLGSKVPFAYTDSYSVTSIVPGDASAHPDKPNEKRIYNAHINSQSIPTIALFHTEETDEDVGLEVQFPVSGSDVRKFVEAARQVFLGFDVQPECNVTIEVHDRILLSGAGWKLLDNRQHSSRMRVRQGCVLYPVDYEAINTSGTVSSIFRDLMNENIVLDMPIGSVDITPSRESLSYDDTTIANIRKALVSIVDELTANAQLQVEAEPTPVLARNKLFQVTRQDVLRSYELRSHICERVRWRGRNIWEWSCQISYRTLSRIAKRLGVEAHVFSDNRMVKKEDHTTLMSIHHSVKSLQGGKYGHNSDLYAFVLAEPGIKRARQRVSALFSDHDGRKFDNVILLTGDAAKTKRALDLIWNALGRPGDIEDSVFDLADVEPKASEGEARKRNEHPVGTVFAAVADFNGDLARYQMSANADLTPLLAEDCLFVMQHGHMPVLRHEWAFPEDGQRLELNTLHELMTLGLQAGTPPKTIILISREQVKRLKGIPAAWSSFEDMLIDFWESQDNKHLDALEFADRRRNGHYHELRSWWEDLFKALENHVTPINAAARADVDYLAEIMKTRKVRALRKKLAEITAPDHETRMLHIQIALTRLEIKDVDKAHKEVLRRFPMLEFVESRGWVDASMLDAVTNYVVSTGNAHFP